MRALTRVRHAKRRLERLFGFGTLALAAAAFLAPDAAIARIESQPVPSMSGNSVARSAETGGNPIISPGPFQVACTQNGLRIVEGRRLDRIALPPSSLIGALSFRRLSDGGQSIILPLDDGLTTCVLAQEPEYLKRATAAFERSIATNRVSTWASTSADAQGQVVPIRSFADSGGRLCREVTQFIMVRGRQETGTGVACRRARGSWQLIR